jgi:hypothetical protein
VYTPRHCSDVLLLLGRAAPFPHCFQDAFTALSVVLLDPHTTAASIATFPLCVQVVMAFASSPHASADNENECLDLLLALARRLPALVAHHAASSGLPLVEARQVIRLLSAVCCLQCAV